jgi:hypothetical protein
MALGRIWPNLTDFQIYTSIVESLDSSDGTATDWTVDGPSSIPSKRKIFLFSTASRPVLGPTQPIQRILGTIFQGVKRPGRQGTTHLQLVPRSRIRGYNHPLLHTYSWRSV